MVGTPVLLWCLSLAVHHCCLTSPCYSGEILPDVRGVWVPSSRTYPFAYRSYPPCYRKVWTWSPIRGSVVSGDLEGLAEGREEFVPLQPLFARVSKYLTLRAFWRARVKASARWLHFRGGHTSIMVPVTRFAVLLSDLPVLHGGDPDVRGVWVPLLTSSLLSRRDLVTKSRECR